MFQPLCELLGWMTKAIKIKINDKLFYYKNRSISMGYIIEKNFKTIW